jgi:hypothetical protein
MLLGELVHRLAAAAELADELFNLFGRAARLSLRNFFRIHEPRMPATPSRR